MEEHASLASWPVSPRDYYRYHDICWLWDGPQPHHRGWFQQSKIFSALTFHLFVSTASVFARAILYLFSDSTLDTIRYKVFLFILFLMKHIGNVAAFGARSPVDIFGSSPPCNAFISAFRLRLFSRWKAIQAFTACRASKLSLYFVHHYFHSRAPFF